MPLLLNQCQFLNFLLHRIVHDYCCPWTVYSHHCIDLRTNLCSLQSRLCVRPNGKYAAHSKIAINDWTSVQRIICYYVTVLLTVLFILPLSLNVHIMWSLFTGKSFHIGTLSQMFLDYLVSVDILSQLLISKLVHWLQLYHRGMLKCNSNLSDGIQKCQQNLRLRRWRLVERNQRSLHDDIIKYKI